MIEIFKPKVHYPITTLYFKIHKLYLVAYSIDINKQDNVCITYFNNQLHGNSQELSEYEVLFDQEIKKTINRFLKLNINQIVNNSLDESNRSFLTHIKNRSDLTDIISDAKRELRRLIRGNFQT